MKKNMTFFRWLRKRFRRKYKELKNLYVLQVQNPTVEIDDNVTIINPAHVHLGKNIFVSRGSLLDCGVGEWCNNGGHIVIGDNTYIASDTILLGAGDIEIQKNCRIGTRVFMTSFAPDIQALMKDNDLFDDRIMPHNFGKITLGEGAMIGAHCIILMGVTIGRGAKIAPGCVIRHNVPENAFVFSNTRLHKKIYPVKK